MTNALVGRSVLNQLTLLSPLVDIAASWARMSSE
jgi:hypothetical protein